MKLLAGVDVGNATTEVVLARATGSTLEVLASGRVPTRRAKGSAESLAGAAALVHRLERRAGVRIDAAVAAPLRPVHTERGVVAEAETDVGPLRVVASGSVTAGGRGFGVGRPVRLGTPPPPGVPVVLVATRNHSFAEVVAEALPLVRDGVLEAVLLEADEAVLVANRLPVDVPVVDEVDPDAVLGAARVAVEVAPGGAPLRSLTDPLRLSAALGLDQDVRGSAAALASLLFDVSNAVVSVGDPAPVGDDPEGWIEVAGAGRLPFLEGHRRLLAGPVGTGRGYALPPECRPHPVDDLWTVDLAEVAASVQARRGATRARPVTLAALRTEGGPVDPAGILADHLGVPVDLAASEAAAARAGGLATPGADQEALVVDLGGGTVDAVGPDGSRVAAGAGDLLTASVAELTGVTAAAAEWVKRGPAHRVEAPQVLLGEDGNRTFLPHPAPRGTVGSLTVQGPAGLMPFATTLAPGEWRALRIRLKVDLLGRNVARAVGTLAPGATPSTVVVVGGSAGDDEVLAAVVGALPAGTAVGRGDVAGLGHRYAVAYGLLLLGAAGA